MTISLTDLKAKRAAMRADEYHDRYTNSVTYVLEAADDLIEIAEAALDRAYAECSCGAKLGCFPDCTREIAGQRLLTALAKIKP